METITHAASEDGSFVETRISDSCSVSISMNAKGKLQYDAKLYFPPEQVEDAPALVKAFTDALEAEYAGRLASDA